MTGPFLRPRRLARDAVAAIVALVAAASAGAGRASLPPAEMLHVVDTGLCPFTLDVRVTRKVRTRRLGAGSITVVGPSEITLRDNSTGDSVVLRASGTSLLDRATGDIRFSGHQLWLGARKQVPYLSTRGKGSRLAPTFVVSGIDPHPRVIDPCALLAAARPSTTPSTTTAPWGLPAFALGQIEYAGLAPLIGNPSRHDHVHLDLVVDGRKITIPAGLGQAEPVDVGPGPCPPPPESLTIGDCAPGHYFTAAVAASPLQFHTTSGIVHIQSERNGTFTLGQLFDQWGVRFDSACLGGYCRGEGRELRVFVDGRRAAGDPRRIELRNRQEIAVVFGRPGDFASVPSTYPLRWPAGCGGRGEPSCFPQWKIRSRSSPGGG